MDSILRLILLTAAGLVGAAVALLWLVRFRRRLLTRHESDALACRKCGYDLTGIRVPRCPECGCVVGFDRTFKELGVDEKEVIEHVEGRGGSEASSREDDAAK